VKWSRELKGTDDATFLLVSFPGMVRKCTPKPTIYSTGGFPCGEENKLGIVNHI